MSSMNSRLIHSLLSQECIKPVAVEKKSNKVSVSSEVSIVIDLYKQRQSHQWNVGELGWVLELMTVILLGIGTLKLL